MWGDGEHLFLMPVNAYLHGGTQNPLLHKLSRCFHTRGEIFMKEWMFTTPTKGGIELEKGGWKHGLLLYNLGIVIISY